MKRVYSQVKELNKKRKCDQEKNKASYKKQEKATANMQTIYTAPKSTTFLGALGPGACMGCNIETGEPHKSCQ